MIKEKDTFLNILITIGSQLEDIKNLIIDMNENIECLLKKTQFVIDETRKDNVKGKVQQWLKLMKK